MQHSYNYALHTTTGNNLFEVYLGYQPLTPIDVALTILESSSQLNSEKEADRVENIFKKIFKVNSSFQKSLDKNTCNKNIDFLIS